MSDPTASRTAALGLLVLATLAWVLPPGLRWASRLLAPATPAIYGLADAPGLHWSPEGATPVPDGYGSGSSGGGELPLGGWEGLLLGHPLDLNRARAKDLEALPGVGPKTAAAILAEREARGGFSAVEDLRNVRGIGPRTLEALRPLVSVGGAGAADPGEGRCAPIEGEPESLRINPERSPARPRRVPRTGRPSDPPAFQVRRPLEKPSSG